MEPCDTTRSPPPLARIEKKLRPGAPSPRTKNTPLAVYHRGSNSSRARRRRMRPLCCGFTSPYRRTSSASAAGNSWEYTAPLVDQGA